MAAVTGCTIGELLSAYLDGELLEGELDAVVEHLAACEPCIAEFHDLKHLRAAVRTLPRLEVPERLMPTSHHGSALSAYLDGELGTAEHELVRTHLADCGTCRVELHELDAARTAVRSMPRVEPPELLDVRRIGRADRHDSRRRLKLATAAASIAAVVALGVGMFTSGSEPARLDLDAFSDRHVARASVEAGFVVLPAVGGRTVMSP